VAAAEAFRLIVLDEDESSADAGTSVSDAVAPTSGG
jgi:hypothetical protein